MFNISSFICCVSLQAVPRSGYRQLEPFVTQTASSQPAQSVARLGSSTPGYDIIVISHSAQSVASPFFLYQTIYYLFYSLSTDLGSVFGTDLGSLYIIKNMDLKCIVRYWQQFKTGTRENIMVYDNVIKTKQKKTQPKIGQERITFLLSSFNFSNEIRV